MGCQECVSPCFSLPNLHCHMFRFTQHHCFDVAALFAKLEASLANLQPISKGGCDKQYKRTTCIELRYLRGSRQDSSPCHLAPDCWIFLCVWGQHLLVLFTASGRKKAPLSKPVRIRDKLSEWICRSCKQYLKKRQLPAQQSLALALLTSFVSLHPHSLVQCHSWYDSLDGVWRWKTTDYWSFHFSSAGIVQANSMQVWCEGVTEGQEAFSAMFHRGWNRHLHLLWTCSQVLICLAGPLRCFWTIHIVCRMVIVSHTFWPNHQSLPNPALPRPVLEAQGMNIRVVCGLPPIYITKCNYIYIYVCMYIQLYSIICIILRCNHDLALLQ